MHRRWSAALILALAFPAAQARHFEAVEPDVPPESMLAGQWMPVSAQLGGQDDPVANFSGGSLQLGKTTFDFNGDHGSYRIVYAGTPARMDIEVSQGPHAGKTIPALYALAGDELTVSYQLGPGVRPQDFNSPAGSKILVVRYHRAH